MDPSELQRKIRSSVTVVIPAKNEVLNIGKVIEPLRDMVHEVIVIDGHSHDGTVQISRQFGARVVQDRKKGKGDAIRVSIDEITTPVAVFIDADGSHDPADLPKLVAPIFEEKCDHVSASRLIGGSSELHGGFDEFLRLAGSAFITACINWRYKCILSDSQNGYRAIKTDVLRELGLRENTTTIEQEMVMKTLKKGFKLLEVPSHEHRRLSGSSHIRISRVWHRYVWSLVKGLFL